MGKQKFSEKNHCIDMKEWIEDKLCELAKCLNIPFLVLLAVLGIIVVIIMLVPKPVLIPA